LKRKYAFHEAAVAEFEKMERSLSERAVRGCHLSDARWIGG
jgi:hypothetical protein